MDQINSIKIEIDETCGDLFSSMQCDAERVLMLVKRTIEKRIPKTLKNIFDDLDSTRNEKVMAAFFVGMCNSNEQVKAGFFLLLSLCDEKPKGHKS